MKRYLFLRLIEKYYQLKKKETVDNKKKLVKLYLDARQAGNTQEEIKQAFNTINRMIGGNNEKTKNGRSDCKRP